MLVGCGGGSSPAPTNTQEDSPSQPDTPTSVDDPDSDGSDNPILLKDIEYGQGATDSGDIALLLDIHQPSPICDENRPTIFFVHGGGL